MAKYATGKKALAISDRSGMQFPYREMVREWNGSFVHISEFEPKQPQLEPKPMNGDAISYVMLDQIEQNQRLQNFYLLILLQLLMDLQQLVLMNQITEDLQVKQ